MKKMLFLLSCLALMTSCATITTKKEYKVKVFSYEPNVKAEINDSTYTLPAMVKVKRSKKDLTVKYITDTLSKDFIVKASPCPAFVYGNLIFLYLSPAGYAVDFTTSKRFYYGRKIVVNSYSKDTLTAPFSGKAINKYFKKNYPTKKGQINLLVSIPYINHFYMQPRNEPVENITGFFGIGAGVEYFYKDYKFLSLKGSYAIDFEVPIPVPLEGDGPDTTVKSLTINATDNFKFNRFSIGYGIDYTFYTWQFINDGYHFPPDPAITDYTDPDILKRPSKKNSHAFGFAFNATHQVDNDFFVGISYNPTFFNTFPVTKFRYQHTISLELVWKIRL